MNKIIISFQVLFFAFFSTYAQLDLQMDHMPVQANSQQQENNTDHFRCNIGSILAEQSELFMTPEGLVAGFNSDLSNNSGQSWEWADNFTAPQDAMVNELCWYGFYFPDTHNDGSVTDEFWVTYYEDNGGLPGNIIAGPYGNNQANKLVRKISDFSEHVFGYRLTHPPFAVTAGKVYWVSIVNNTSSLPTDHWDWILSSDYDTDVISAIKINGSPFMPINMPIEVGTDIYGFNFTIGYTAERIPTLSEWGILVMILTFLIAGTVALRSRVGIKSRASA